MISFDPYDNCIVRRVKNNTGISVRQLTREGAQIFFQTLSSSVLTFCRRRKTASRLRRRGYPGTVEITNVSHSKYLIRLDSDRRSQV